MTWPFIICLVARRIGAVDPERAICCLAFSSLVSPFYFATDKIFNNCTATDCQGLLPVMGSFSPAGWQLVYIQNIILNQLLRTTSHVNSFGVSSMEERFRSRVLNTRDLSGSVLQSVKERGKQHWEEWKVELHLVTTGCQPVSWGTGTRHWLWDVLGFIAQERDMRLCKEASFRQVQFLRRDTSVRHHQPVLLETGE